MRFWLFRKFIFQKKIFLEPTTLFSLFGISLGVAFLIVSMAGFSGFTNALKNSIIDVSGDIVVFKRGGRISKPDEMLKEIQEASTHVQELLPYVQLEALVANKGQLTAVFLQGVDWNQSEKVLKLKSRRLSQIGEGVATIGHPAYLGKVVAKKLRIEAKKVALINLKAYRAGQINFTEVERSNLRELEAGMNEVMVMSKNFAALAHLQAISGWSL